MNVSAHDSTGLVSITEAATLLTADGDPIDRSTLSRYVSRWAVALSPAKLGRETVVDYEKLKLHRAENIRLDAKPLAKAVTKSDSQARKLDADARLRELDLAEREGKITLRSEVAEAAQVAIAELRAALDAAVNDAAEQIGHAVASEPRLIRPALRKMVAKGFEAFCERMRSYSLGVTAGASESASSKPAEHS
ncbi:hypothetical protein WI560_13500 [Bradyrhizobium sp. A11]|uniref:hypothetical protein n=1 Tax=Bradyrhizobium sp. A11 TaxID=3133974 RepID=UPI003253119E